ncbi:MAG TPA: DUF4089 domain-containing protein [Xenococcaceae cyanobacterium]
MTKASNDWTNYLEQTAKLMNLNLTATYLPGVRDNFVSMANIAALVTEFELPEDIEIAPVFKP